MITYNKLNWHDLQRCLLRCPPEVLSLLSANPLETFVAGGFVRSCVSGEEISDVDIFVPSETLGILLADQYLHIPGWKPQLRTANAITVPGWDKPTIQFIYRWTFTDPTKALDSFDYTIAKGAFWSTKPKDTLSGPDCLYWESACHPDFYADVAAKRLIYTSPERIEEAGGSLLRVLKFYQRGYKIPLEDFARVISRCVSGINMNSLPTRPSSHNKPPYSREEAIAVAVLEQLREVDPSIDPMHIAHLPSPPES